MAKKAGAVILAGVIAFVILVATRSDRFDLQRSIVIGVPPQHVFAFVNDLQAWAEWSPWVSGRTLDCSEQSAGPGASCSFAGPSSGRLIVFESRTNERVLTQATLSAFPTLYRSDLELTALADGTRVVWRASGSLSIADKFRWLGSSADTAIENDLALGLQNLQRLCENDAKRGPDWVVPKPAPMPGQTTTAPNAPPPRGPGQSAPSGSRDVHEWVGSHLRVPPVEGGNQAPTGAQALGPAQQFPNPPPQQTNAGSGSATPAQATLPAVTPHTTTLPVTPPERQQSPPIPQ